MAAKANIQLTKAQIVQWTITIILTVTIALIPTNAVFTREIRTFLAIVVFYILLLAFDLVNQFVVAIGLPVTFKVFNVASGTVIMGGWTGTTPFVALGCLVMAVVMEECGLLKRISLWIIKKVGGTYRNTVIALFLAALISSFMTSCCVNYVFAAIAYGVCRTMGLERSKESCVVMCAAMVGTMTSQALIPYPPALGLLFASGSTDEMVISESWTEYVYHNWPAIFLLVAIVLVMVSFWTRNVNIGTTKQKFIAQYEELGPMSRNEKKASVMIVLTFLYLISTVFTGMSSDWPFLILPVLFYLPVIGISSQESLKKVNFSMVFLIASFISIGNVANNLGLGTLLADLLTPYFQGTSETGIIGMTYSLGFLFNFLLTPFAMYTAFSGPLTHIALAQGINPLAIMHTLLLTGDAILLPYENLGYMVYFGFGMCTMKDFVKIYGSKVIIEVVFIFLILVPWWKLCGFL